MANLIVYTLLYTSVLVLVALGGCFSEHSGVINLGLEGIMVIGALGGALALKYFGHLDPVWVVLITLAFAIGFGVVYSLLLAVAAINFKADQTIVGTAMNMLSVALATVIVKSINLIENPDNPSSTIEYVTAGRKLKFTIFGLELNWFVVATVIILIASYIILYKTKFGLRLMACGEHPQAADSVGINVNKFRYIGVMISGALGGLGGIAFITSGVSQWKFEYGVAGFGFLALAVMIFGQWKPHKIMGAGLIFGLFRSLSNVYSGFPWLVALRIPSGLYNTMPYVISLIVLILTSKESRAPKAEGIPYDKGMR